MATLPDLDAVDEIRGRVAGMGPAGGSYLADLLLRAIRNVAEIHRDCDGCSTCRELSYALAVTSVIETRIGTQVGSANRVVCRRSKSTDQPVGQSGRGPRGTRR